MKTHLLYIALPLLLLACSEEEVPLYNEAADRLSFWYPAYTAGLDVDSAQRYTFVYEPRETMEDTMWVEVITSGFVTNYPRPVALRQLESDPPRAVPGTHYVPFDDPRAASLLVIPAGASRARLPLLVKRGASLTEAEHTLRVGIVENEYFKPGFRDVREKLLTVSDILVRPATWDPYIDMLFTAYGPETHRFMIDVAPPGVIIDDFFFEGWYDPRAFVNMGLFAYWTAYFEAKLQEENVRRLAEGLDILREAPAEGESQGRALTFFSPYVM
ncbi:MAG: DUF4843 domain-containing protein [Odoribacteraceae bacterium]|jgi:hypothetical protein|nr:DUF4843 domain-containing protein [Odoribacteraceae bacterium]